ncbi:MAG TPA: glycosyltransferase family 1 protein [Anaerolineales bacterium]|nr:glycosyltransferase family 1 protein [Anaerolineae bacterium]HIQ02351.1 glycosyltransferase family 1 protein [Anaerolineales bacterium]
MDAAVGWPVHVAINAHLLSGDPSYRSAGVHQYIYHLLAYLPEAGCRVTALLGPTGTPPGGAVQTIRSRWPTGRPAARVVWEQLVQPWALRRTGADLAHGPVFVGPLVAPCPLVVTVHDLSFLRFPHLFRPANRLYLTLLTRASVRRARRVIAVSTHAAEETTQLLGVSRGKVDVVYHGVDPKFRPLPPDEVRAFRAHKGLPDRFVLYVGTLEPRKNLVRLIEAFARLREPGLRLVLVGGRGWYDQEVFACVERLGLQERVVFPGYVPAEQLPLWYNAATAFAYPSLYEGFGMPVVEAQACGLPVLTSDRSSLPEAAGEGGMPVDPYDVAAIAAGLHRLLTDEALRETLRQRGLAHASHFTWQKTAAETIAVYHRAVSGDRGQ